MAGPQTLRTDLRRRRKLRRGPYAGDGPVSSAFSLSQGMAADSPAVVANLRGWTGYAGGERLAVLLSFVSIWILEGVA